MSFNKNCPNCDTVLGTTDRFCSNCGQKDKKNLLSVANLLSELVENVLNIDSKIFRSLKRIWIPARLTKDYVAGVRNKNLNQFRFFASVLIIHVAVIAFALKNISIDGINVDLVKSVTKSKLLDSFEENSPSILAECTPGTLDSLRQYLFEGVTPLQEDSLDFDFKIGKIDLTKLGLTKHELLESSPDSIIIEKNISGLLNKLTIKQLFRAVHHPDAIVSSAIGNLLWLGVIIVFLGALFLKLIYFRNMVYLVEHVVLLANFQIFAWIITSALLVFNMLTQDSAIKPNLFSTLILSNLYLFLSMKFYYQQGWFKTFLKFLMLSAFYVLAISASATLVLLISFYLF